MIVTLTANPSLDRTMTVPAPLRVGDVQAASSAREDAGGKGINVARAIAAAGEPCLAILPLAGDDPFEAALRGARLDAQHVPVRGHVRTNLAITDPAGVTTKLNLPGAANTEFSNVRFKGDEALASKVYEGLEPLLAQDVADIIYYTTTLPPHVCINDLVVTCTQQANSFYSYKKTAS